VQQKTSFTHGRASATANTTTKGSRASRESGLGITARYTWGGATGPPYISSSSSCSSCSCYSSSSRGSSRLGVIPLVSTKYRRPKGLFDIWRFVFATHGPWTRKEEMEWDSSCTRGEGKGCMCMIYIYQPIYIHLSIHLSAYIYLSIFR